MQNSQVDRAHAVQLVDISQFLPTPSYPRVTSPPTRRGDPVDVSTGLFTMEKTDLVLPDVIPIVLQRQHRAGDSSVGLFGQGQHDIYSMGLFSNPHSYTVVDLVLGDGASIRFDAINPSAPLDARIWEHTGSPTAWQKAQVVYVASQERWRVTRTDGMQYEFSGHFGSYLLSIRDARGNQLTIERVFTPRGLGTGAASHDGQCASPRRTAVAWSRAPASCNLPSARIRVRQHLQQINNLRTRPLDPPR